MRDERVTDYIAPVRIVASSGCSGGEILLKESRGQATTASCPECVFESGGWIVLDFGREYYGGIELTVGAFSEPERKLLVTFGESVAETFSYPKHGHTVQETELQLIPWSVLNCGKLGFRFVKLENPETFSVGIQAIRMAFLHREFSAQGSFRCSDPLLNQIWETSAWTLKLCMQDYIWDGVKRDQLVWMGDLLPELIACATIFGHQKAVEKSLDFLRDETPLPNMMNGCGTYSFWWIIGQHYWYRRFGSLEYLKEQHSYLKGLVTHLSGMVADDGTLNFKGGYQLLDWATGISVNDGPAILTGSHAILRIAFLAAAELFRVLGDEDTALLCAGSAEKLLRKELPLTHSTAANAFQVLAGFRDAKRVYDQCFSGKLPKGLSTFLGCFVLDACAKAGHRKEALGYLREYWGGMLSVGATSFWEHFDPDWLNDVGRIDEMVPAGTHDIHGEYGEGCYKSYRNSFCHGWGSMPAEWLIRQICGVDFVDSRTIKFNPDLCGLEWAEAEIPVSGGMICVKISDGQKKISVPDGFIVAE